MPASATKREAVAARRAKALRLRAAGSSYEAIAEQCGLKSAAAACTDVQRALKDRQSLLDQEASWFLALEMERLETVQRTMELALRQAQDAQLQIQITDRLLRISARRAAMLGLDVTNGAAPPKPETKLDELKARRDRKLARGA